MQDTDRIPPRPISMSPPSSAAAVDDAAASFPARAVLDLLPVALLALDRALTIRFRNAAAAALAECGDLPGAAPGAPLRLCRRGDLIRLAGLVPLVAAGGPPAALRLSGQAEEATFCGLLRPLPGPEPLVLLTLRPLRAAPALAASDLAGLFGLTPTEAAIALALATSDTAERIAEARGRSLATIRTQIRGVLRKTGCTTILDMATLLTRLGA